MPEQVHEHKLKDDDGNPKETFPSQGRSPRGEDKNDAMKTSAGDSKAGTGEDPPQVTRLGLRALSSLLPVLRLDGLCVPTGDDVAHSPGILAGRMMKAPKIAPKASSPEEPWASPIHSRPTSDQSVAQWRRLRQEKGVRNGAKVPAAWHERVVRWQRLRQEHWSGPGSMAADEGWAEAGEKPETDDSGRGFESKKRRCRKATGLLCFGPSGVTRLESKRIVVGGRKEH